MAVVNYFDPSPNVEDRREEIDPIQQFLADAGVKPSDLDIARFGNPAGTYNAQEYWAENPVPPIQGLVKDAGVGDIQAEMEAAQEAKMRRYREMLQLPPAVPVNRKASQ